MLIKKGELVKINSEYNILNVQMHFYIVPSSVGGLLPRLESTFIYVEVFRRYLSKNLSYIIKLGFNSQLKDYAISKIENSIINSIARKLNCSIDKITLLKYPYDASKISVRC